MPRRATWTLLRPTSRWVLLLLTLVPLASQADAPLAPSHLDRAVQASVSGDLTLARAELAHLPQGEESTPRALFVKACVFLDSGDLETAADAARALRERLPGSPEPLLLQTLIALRREQPALAWREAYLGAWNAAGRPDLEESPFGMKWELARPPISDIDELWKKDLAPDTRLVLALAGTPDAERIRFVIQQFPSLDAPVLAIASYGLMDSPSMPAELKDALALATRKQLPALIAASPEEMDLQLLALMDGTRPESPFSAVELEALEAIAGLPEWRSTDFAELYQWMRHHLKAAGVSSSSGMAFSGAVGAIAGSATSLLLRRTTASLAVLPPSERLRLGEALWRIGSHMAMESTLVEYLVGTLLMLKGAQAQSDPDRLREVNDLREEGYAAYRAWTQAAPSAWPLYSLREAVFDANVHDEVGHMRSYLPAH